MKKTTLILGASTKSERYSNIAFHKLKAAGHPVYALGYREGFLDDNTPIHTTPQPQWNAIDTVTVYLNPTNQELYYDYLLKLKPKRVLFNYGSENKTFAELLQNAGIGVEKSVCTLVLLSTNQY